VPGLTVLLVVALYAPWRKWLSRKRNGGGPAGPAEGRI
jgi:hypothetical protein